MTLTKLKNILTVPLLLISLVGGSVVMTVPAQAAYDPINPACDQLSNTEKAQSPTCNARTTENPLTGPNGTLQKIATIIAIIAGIAAVIMIMVGGFKMITSSGDAQAVAGARKTVIGALIGLVVIVLARSIIVFVLGRM
jgi:hypothetical protein